MNTKLLKQKILDLAIRGKLTQQLKSDGTAADLLKEICDRTQEKTSLRAKRGNPSPQTIIPLDKNEAPFEIPANWEWVRLNDIFNFIDYRGMTPEKVDKGVPLITAKNVKKGYIDFSIDEYISEESYAARQGRGSPQKGDILFTTEAPLGNVALAGIDKYSPGQRIITFQQYTKEKLLDNRFFVFFFLSDLFQNLLVDQKTGTTVTGIKAAKLKMIPVLLPPLAEQQRIVEKIQEAFAEIDSIENNKELLKTHIKQARQKILDLAIHGKLVPQNKSDEPASVLLERITCDNPHYEKIENEPFEIPENWAWAKLPDVCRAPITDGTHNSPPNTNEGEFFYITAKNIKDDGVDLSNVSYVSKEIHNSIVSRCCPEKGDVLLTKDGTIGNATVNNLNQPFSLLSSVALIKTHRKVLPWYVVFCLRSSYLQKSMKNDAKGTALKRVILSQINDFVIPLPPFNEQSRIVTKIEELFSTLDQMERNLV